MATKATVKKYDFVVRIKVGNTWKKTAVYTAVKPSLPAAITAFYKWFNGWYIEENVYRFDALVGDSEVWMDSYIPEFDS